MFFDPLYIVIALPALLLSLMASGFLWLVYNIYSGDKNNSGRTGLDTAAEIADAYNLQVSFAGDNGKLTDNYDPRNQTVTLSHKVYHESSIASVAIAAHELGHVMQYQKGSILISFRSLLLPIVNIGTNIGYFMIIIGFLISLSGLVWVGIAFFSLSTFFTLLTLPVEFDASRRGLQAINRLRLLDGSEMNGARLVLFAAALTYVAAAIGSALNLLYFIMRARGLNRD